MYKFKSVINKLAFINIDQFDRKHFNPNVYYHERIQRVFIEVKIDQLPKSFSRNFLHSKFVKNEFYVHMGYRVEISENVLGNTFYFQVFLKEDKPINKFKTKKRLILKPTSIQDIDQKNVLLN